MSKRWQRFLWWLIATFLLSLTLPASSVTAADDDYREVIYGHKDGLALTFDVFEPTSPANGSAVVFIVSGGWHSKWNPPQQTRFILSPFLAAGYKTFAVRHGSSPRYSIAEAVSDVRQAIRFIRRDAESYDIDPNRIGVIGMSAGGHLTLMLATTGDDGDAESDDPLAKTSSRITAGVALVPPSDLTNYVWSTPGLADQYRRFPALDITKDEAKAVSPLYHVTADDAPCLIISGGKDTLVLPEQGRMIHDKMDATDVENQFILYENSGHGLENDMPQAITESLEWFKKQFDAAK
ncbi:alpha/beta hydrolase [Rhodopirellula sp. MGV]|uniref:alpha/beta hydrolase n=1 Tax=Rhodopirellula sp. MGV TaxID=2023130 RepID=UPI000B96F138|nr:alpha/beta hydrolase [Rhodopirellula sp. MGV]OYP38168.1 hypothetical protein CGZ80_02760 [Rhodopirellula sp. MGV]PNY38502.1 alpha/beta hydrolase [Rhodopirellula baltica]